MSIRDTLRRLERAFRPAEGGEEIVITFNVAAASGRDPDEPPPEPRPRPKEPPRAETAAKPKPKRKPRPKPKPEEEAVPQAIEGGWVASTGEPLEEFCAERGLSPFTVRGSGFAGAGDVW